MPQGRSVWEGEYSDYVSRMNGVRKRVVVTTVIFTVYMDEGIQKLKKSGLGCHIGHRYGSLGYADA